MKNLFTVLICTFFACVLRAQTIAQQTCLGGSAYDNTVLGGPGSSERGYRFYTKDSGFIFLGTTYSNNGTFAPNKGLQDVFAVKVNKAGMVEWSKNIGTAYEENDASA